MRAGSVILGVVALAGAAAAFWLLSPRGERSLETEGPPTRPESAPEAPHLQGKPATPAAAEASKEATSAWVRVLRRDDAPVSGARIEVRAGNTVQDLQRAPTMASPVASVTPEEEAAR